MDYLLFLYGLSFGLLAAAAFACHRSGDRRLPWRCLGLFGLTHAVADWFALLALSHGDQPVVVVPRAAFLVVSFVLLFRFGRLGLRSTGGRAPGAWLEVLLLIPSLGALPQGLAASEAAARWFLAMPGAWLAAVAMWRDGTGLAPPERRPFRLASVAMAGYAVAAGLIGPATPSGPAALINQGTFAELFRFPVEVLRCLLAAVIAAAVMRRYWSVRAVVDAASGVAVGLRFERWTAMALAAAAVAGFVVAAVVGRGAEERERGHMQAVALTAAAALDQRTIAGLAGDDTDLARPSYRLLKQQLTDMRHAHPRWRFFYLFGERHGEIVFLVDSEQPNSDGYSPPGQVYEEASAELKAMFRTGEDLFEGPLADRWGVWLSALTAIRDPATGGVVAALGIDFDAAAWLHNVRRERLWPLLATLLVTVLLLLSMVSQQVLHDAAAQIKRSERLHRTLVEGSPDGVALFDADGRCLAANAPAEQLATDGSIVGSELPELWPEAVRAPVAEAVAGAAAGRPSGFEVARPGPDGDQVWVGRLNPVLDEGGQVRLIVGVLRDITARRRAERAERDHLARLEAVVTNAPGVAIQGFDHQGVVRRWNPACEVLYGYRAEEAIGRTIPELVLDDREAEAFRLELAEICATGRPAPQREWHVRDRDGMAHWVYSSMFPVVSGETVDEVICMDVDITDRKLAEAEWQRQEEQLRHTQKLESLAVLAGGIAHDFNNLLTVILGQADLTLAALPKSSGLTTNLNAVITASERAAELCAQLLAYAGLGRIVVAPLDLSAVVREAAPMLRLSAGKAAELRYELADDLPAVEADPTQLRQLLGNLVLNASEALGDGPGEVVVRTGLVDRSSEALARTLVDDCLPGGQYLFLEVGDTGCGMDESTRARIFDPFFSTKFTGRGLGLPAVLGIVRGHHGAIEVDTAPGRGSTFRVLLPTSAQPLAPPPPAPPPAAWHGSGTVLLVDDEESVRQVGRQVLEHLGFRVLTAADGDEAAHVFAAHREHIRAVVLDLTMPRMDGAETLAELRRIRPEVPVVLASGYAERELQDRFADAGFNGFLQKPYTVADMTRKLRRALGEEAEGTEAG